MGRIIVRWGCHPAERFDAHTARREWDESSDSYVGRQERGEDFYRYEFFGPETVKRGTERVVGIDISPSRITSKSSKAQTES